MLEYFHGAPKRIVCDNLKTAVVSHPKEEEIILTDQYLDFAEYYSMAIMPAAVRKPKQKASVENTVGNIETFIIARARNITFTSFNQLKLYVMERFQKYNDQPFQKRDGSRSSEFEEEKTRFSRFLIFAMRSQSGLMEEKLTLIVIFSPLSIHW
ncbi:hypothetical protein SG0102_23090 [Intestinibaculum porci]|uniref:Integrase catalytic domain-containing protein n=2 Tax=Intestinibaculum porci TaxID=2487118 RepID=A0A3G9JG76_9FIRM|nr:hypothetical protein SG0102_23090 [Intestinibaculum porci]